MEELTDPKVLSGYVLGHVFTERGIKLPARLSIDSKKMEYRFSEFNTLWHPIAKNSPFYNSFKGQDT